MTNALSKLAKKIHTSYTKQSGFCWLNAGKNKAALEAAGIPCKIVYGSLGLNGHFEYGGKNHTLSDFQSNPTDSHVWVEDEDGNVYDFLYEWYGECAAAWRKKVSFPLNYEIKGESKEDLKRKWNVEYVAADSKSQLVIQRAFKPSVFSA